MIAFVALTPEAVLYLELAKPFSVASLPAASRRQWRKDRICLSGL
jgi:hypothetical protein